jgi:hypothetical protein
MERTTASLSVHEVAAIMATALGPNPEQATPPGCIRLLLGCWEAFTEGQDLEILTEHADLFSLWMRFATATRSPKGISALDRTLAICRCHTNDVLRAAPRDLHEHFTGPEVSLEWLISRIFETSLWPWENKRVNIFRHPRRSAWPRSLSDLIYTDVESATFMILAWTTSSALKAVDGLILLRRIVDACKSSAVAGIIKARGMLWTWLTKTVHAMVAMFDDPNVRFKKENMGVNTIFVLHNAGLLLRSASAVMFDEEFLLWIEPTKSGQELIDLGTHVLAVIPELHRAMEQPAREAHVEIAAETDGAWRDLMIRILRCTPNFPWINLKAVLRADHNRDTRRHRNPYFRYVAAGSAWQQRCASPGCFATYANSENHFRTCGGCKILYCSRQCQRHAWRHPTSAHRTVCSSMRRLRIALIDYPDTVKHQTKLDRTMPSKEINAIQRSLSGIRKTRMDALGKIDMLLGRLALLIIARSFAVEAV